MHKRWLRCALMISTVLACAEPVNGGRGGPGAPPEVISPPGGTSVDIGLPVSYTGPGAGAPGRGNPGEPPGNGGVPAPVPRPPQTGDRRTVYCQVPQRVPAPGGPWWPNVGTIGQYLGCTLAESNYQYLDGAWRLIGGACMQDAECVANPVDQTWLWPCEPVIAANGAVLQFNCNNTNWSGALAVATECPVNSVLRDSYPRVLVNTDIQFLLEEDQWSPSTGGNASTPISPNGIAQFIDADGAPTRTGIWRNFVLRARSQRFNGSDLESWFGQRPAKPFFHFPDSTTLSGAGGYKPEQEGALAVYRWQAASANGQPRGRRYDVQSDSLTNDYNVPAYQVTVRTSCGHSWSASWETAEEYQEFTANCQITPDPLPADWTRNGCANPGDAHPFVRKFRWATLSTGGTWQGIDMRTLPVAGLQTSYALQYASRGGGYFQSAGEPVYDPIGEMWVPVVEVQSVLRGDECVTDAERCPSP
jgi:hypothetical protein